MICDFKAPWFSKFVPPDVVMDGEQSAIQVTCHRNMFLQAFNITDDTELEFMVTLHDNNVGEMKVIRTRGFMLVESTLAL